MKVTVLGSGVMIPTKERNPAGFLIEVEDKKILLDCGHGVIRRLIDYGFKLSEIDMVFISHFHTDHFSDFCPLIHARWVEDAYLEKDNRSILAIGPNGLEKQFQNWRSIFWREPEEKHPIKFKEGIFSFEELGLKVETFPVNHVRWFESIGIKLSCNGKTIVYPGDLGPEQPLFYDKVENADLLIIEGGYSKPYPNHLSFKQIEELVRRQSIKQSLIVHIRPQFVTEIEELVKNNSNIILGIDGLRLEI